MTRLGDEELLEALLAHDGLDADDRIAFAGMLERRRDAEGRYQHALGLTRPQRQWAEDRYQALELDAEEGAANLFSSGKVPRGIPDPSARHFESLSKPMLLPHRMPKKDTT